MSMPVFAGATTLAIGKISCSISSLAGHSWILNLRRCGLLSGKSLKRAKTVLRRYGRYGKSPARYRPMAQRSALS